MTTPHLANLALHIGSGTLAIGLGLVVLARPKGDTRHRQMGRWFVWMTALVTATATLGLVAFRFLPLFAVLTLLVLYQLVSGWRVAQTGERGPDWPDLAWTVGAALTAGPLVTVALAEAPQAKAVILGSVGALATVVGYDLARWLFPRAWHRTAWPIEHLYKMNAALFGMISAFVGNTVRVGQPWSQLLPSVVGFAAIAYQLVRLRQRGLPAPEG